MPDFAVGALMDAAGVAALAGSGTLGLGSKASNLGSALLVGCVAGLSGLTLRDLLLRAPVSLIADPRYTALVAVASAVVWASGHQPRMRLLFWLDAVGLAMMTASSTLFAAQVGAPPLTCVAVGALTGCLGGVARDVVLRKEPAALRGGIYVSAAIVGAAVYVLLRIIAVSPAVAAGLSAGSTFALRFSASPRVFGDAESSDLGSDEREA